MAAFNTNDRVCVGERTGIVIRVLPYGDGRGAGRYVVQWDDNQDVSNVNTTNLRHRETSDA